MVGCRCRNWLRGMAPDGPEHMIRQAVRFLWTAFFDSRKAVRHEDIVKMAAEQAG